jgi:hypothetical protein
VRGNLRDGHQSHLEHVGDDLHQHLQQYDATVVVGVALRSPLFGKIVLQ